MKAILFKMFTILFCHGLIGSLKGQSLIIGFYNCENFYDTTNQMSVTDEDFLPNSPKHYNTDAYNVKSNHLANVIYKLGRIDHGEGLALMGLVEIENKTVLNKLINEPFIKKYHYKIIHFDSKDQRGVDVALLYNPVHFTPYQYKPFSLSDKIHFNNYATRDILFVKGILGGSWVYILVNHWPSRRGGEYQSADKRKWASEFCKNIMDSVYLENPTAQFIVMGDFNDNPSNKSVEDLKMNNPFLKLYRKGMGTLAYNDAWSLFDQILISKNWGQSLGLNLPNNKLTNYKPVIYNNHNMIESAGRYQGYPKRTYDGNKWRGGYSDHFPVALIFTPKMAENPQ